MFDKKIPNPELRKFKMKLELFFTVIPATVYRADFLLKKKAFYLLARMNGTKVIFMEEGHWETYFAFVHKGKTVHMWLKTEVKA